TTRCRGSPSAAARRYRPGRRTGVPAGRSAPDPRTRLARQSWLGRSVRVPPGRVAGTGRSRRPRAPAGPPGVSRAAGPFTHCGVPVDRVWGVRPPRLSLAAWLALVLAGCGPRPAAVFRPPSPSPPPSAPAPATAVSPTPAPSSAPPAFVGTVRPATATDV